MRIFKNPDWIKEFEYPYESFDQIPQKVFDEINEGLDKIQSPTPKVSIIITAWNEETNIIRSVGSLSKLKTKIPFEIILINNNSSDRTQDTMDRLHVKNFFQGKQGWGPARQMGQEKALGEYILLADADCLYPDCWLDEMVNVLVKPGVVAVYGRYSFISEPGFPRWQLSILETFKDIIAEVRQIKRPYLNTYGLSMGYVKKYGLEAGFVNNNFRGNDGRLAYDLMAYGKIKQVRSNKSRVWTGPRTLQKDGSLSNALKKRILREVKRFSIYFHTHVKYHAPKD
ncbi:glycosyltransferase family 2 protein [Danxiaibacter flavus]|uniref:Glycosyltransferase family 2 protein n=1 Tax=Danxiaibacter flavus TaxID=3049108 RepID=A0ABV3ZGG9_9BACT|nr:glycosyltransferase family 2 protein [Chitinophagaceae bacterium DXS]